MRFLRFKPISIYTDWYYYIYIYIIYITCGNITGKITGNITAKSHFFSFQRCRTAFRDFHIHKIAHAMRTPIENHYPVLLGTSEELVARTLGHSLHQYFVGSQRPLRG